MCPIFKGQAIQEEYIYTVDTKETFETTRKNTSGYQG
jgi:hypothetical protein